MMILQMRKLRQRAVELTKVPTWYVKALILNAVGWLWDVQSPLCCPIA